MTDLTLRGTKGSPLTHDELDANFVALDSDMRAGNFDSGIFVVDGILIESGDIDIESGDLILRNGDIKYNPKLGFIDLVASSETMRLDSSGSLLVGSKVNSQDVNLKVTRSGNQHLLLGNKVSQQDQTTFLQLGAAGDGTEKSCGIKATQTTTNFEDWKLSLVSWDGSQYIDAIDINPDGSIDVNGKIEFHDSATFNDGMTVNGDIKLFGNILLNGTYPPTGTVEQVGLVGPTGFNVLNSPVTSIGTLILEYESTHSRGVPPNTSQNQWDTAYGWGDHSQPGYLLTSDFDATLDSALGGTAVVFETRNINTGNGLSGGGNMSADRTLTMSGSYTGNFDVTGSGTYSSGLTVTGDIQASGNVIAYYNASDERLKENITVIDNALDKVSTLKGVQFNYIASGIKSTGLIAQDLERVLPEAVFEDDDGYKGIRYQVTVGLLVEAIKELKAEIEDLKKAK